MLTGKLVRLRPIEMTDLDRYWTWVNDAEVMQHVAVRALYSRDEEEAILRRLVMQTQPPEVVLAIEIAPDQQHIGSIALHEINALDRRATLGIMIGDKTYWSRGYGTDAVLTMLRYGFEELNLNRIDLTCDEHNARGIACYRKCGFVEEGRLRKHRFSRGTYWDTVVMAVLADEFLRGTGPDGDSCMKDGYYLDPRVALGYDAEHESSDITTDDVPFYVELAKEAGAAGHKVLELACGTGRVTLPIAEAGVQITGIDSSPAMLDIARQKTDGRDNPSWLEADMASFKLDERFGLVIIPFRSFLHMLTVADQKGCLRSVHEHLIDGGRLALNFFNPSMLMMAEWLTDQRDTRRLVERSAEAERWESVHYSTAGQTLDYEQIDDRLSDANAVISRVYRNMRLRYVYRYEMEHLLALTGFTVEALYGWFDQQPFSDSSQEMIWVARKITDSNQ